MKRKIISLSLLPIFVTGLLAACGPQAVPTLDPTVLAVTVDARVTELAAFAAQTQAAMPTPTPPLPPTDTAAPAPLPEATAAPTAFQVDFTGFEIFTAFLEDGKTQVSIIVPNGITGDYEAKIGEKDFSCFSYMMKGVARLICVGPSLPRGYIVDMAVYPKGIQESIFEHKLVVPY